MKRCLGDSTMAKSRVTISPRDPKTGRFAKRIEQNVQVMVGVRGVNYAIYVHENLEARHTEGQRAKFLSDPVEYATEKFIDELNDQIKQLIKNGMSVRQAIISAALRWQRASQQVVPVDTGNLKGSFFTEEVRHKSGQDSGI